MSYGLNEISQFWQRERRHQIGLGILGGGLAMIGCAAVWLPVLFLSGRLIRHQYPVEPAENSWLTLGLNFLLITVFYLWYKRKYENDDSFVTSPEPLFRPYPGNLSGGGLVIILLLSPFLFFTALRAWRYAVRWLFCDSRRCARLLLHLANAPGQVPLDQLEEYSAVLADFQLLDGVVLLRRPPAGLALSDNLRNKLRDFRRESADF